ERARLPREAARAHGRDRALPPARADDGPRHGCTGHGAGEGVEPVEADHMVHGLDCRRLFGPGLGIAAGEDYPRVRVQATRAARARRGAFRCRMRTVIGVSGAGCRPPAHVTARARSPAVPSWPAGTAVTVPLTASIAWT